MASATTDRDTTRREGSYQGFGLAALASIILGCMCCYDADGYLVDGANTSGYKFAGIAKESVDNSSGADEDETGDFWVTGQFQLASSGLTDADVGSRVYLSDNQTVTTTVTNVYVGTIAEVVSATVCWVDIDPAGQAAADLDAHLDGSASKHDASEIDVEGGHTNFPDGALETALGTADTAISANTTHSTGDGSDHADVATNTTHSAGDGSDHADVAANSSDIVDMIFRMQHSCYTWSNIGNAIANGVLRTNANTQYNIDGANFYKVQTSSCWDLSGEVDTTGTQWRAYWLYIDAAGAFSFEAGSNSEVSEADAIDNLPSPSATKAVVGVYVAGNSCDFDGALGLAAQGTIVNGWPTPLAASA